MSHSSRLLIACALSDGERNVGEIEAATGVQQPHLSRELAKLRDAGLVTTRREAKYVYYSLADDRLSKLIDALCRVFGPQHRRPRTGDRA